MTAFTLHFKTTAHNSTTTVLEKFSVLQRYYTVHSISTPKVLQYHRSTSKSILRSFIRREEFILVRAVNLLRLRQTSDELFISYTAVTI